jgi:methylated-DNA-[protein]-cysteine S-methyltransferase
MGEMGSGLSRLATLAIITDMRQVPPTLLLVERLKTPLGPLLLTHDGEALWNIAFEDREERRAAELARHAPGATARVLRQRSNFATALQAYFEGDVHAIDGLRVAVMGTPFQRKAWTALRKVPAGTTRSYGEQAARIGHANAARAVGRANGLNPVSIVVPCHRLVGSDGALVRYGGGLERKRWLIDHEARATGDN